MQLSDLKNKHSYILRITPKYATVSVAHEGYWSKMQDGYVGGGHTNESVKAGVFIQLFKLDESDVKKTAAEFAEKCTALDTALTNLGLSYDKNISDFVRQKAVHVRTSLEVKKSDIMSEVYIPDPRIEDGAWFLHPHTTWSGNFSANFYKSDVYLHADGCQPYYAARAEAVVDHMGSWWLAGIGEDKSKHLHELLDRLITTPKATEVEQEIEIECEGELASEEQLTSLLAKFKK
jgi:hypothetical protein